MDIFKSFATNTDAEVAGVWKDISADAKIKVARAGNRPYSRSLTKQIEKYRAALDTKDDVADDTSDMIMVDLLAEHILLDWEGISYKGEVLPYTKDNAKMLLRVKDFRKLVSAQSDTLANFLAEKEEDQLKS